MVQYVLPLGFQEPLLTTLYSLARLQNKIAKKRAKMAICCSVTKLSIKLHFGAILYE